VSAAADAQHVRPSQGADLSTPDIKLATVAALKSRGLVLLILILGLIYAVNRLAVSNTALLVVIPVALILAGGYLTSYSHTVALGDSAPPPATPLGTHARRGLSWFVVALPGFVISVPALILIAYPWVVLVLPRWLELGLFGIFAGAVIAACTLPFVASYLIADRIAAGYRLKDNISAGWRYRRLLTAPVAFAALSGAIQLALSRLLFALTAAPVLTVGDTYPRPTGLAVLGDDPVTSVAALLIVGVTAAFLQVVSAHVDGQYARMLHERRSVPV